MPYIIVGVAMYMLYRYFSKSAAPPAVVNLDDLPDGGGTAPAVDGGGGNVQPAPTTPVVTWQPIAEGDQLTPGADYRASAPPQGMFVMAVIPTKMTSSGFTNVTIYKPGDAFPNDWPDSGDALRIAATLPAGAEPQTFNLDGVKVWRKVVQQSAGRAVRQVVHTGVEYVRRIPQRYPHPSSNGVYAGLVRRP